MELALQLINVFPSLPIVNSSYARWTLYPGISIAAVSQGLPLVDISLVLAP